jgi:hypothetical protein
MHLLTPKEKVIATRLVALAILGVCVLHGAPGCVV